MNQTNVDEWDGTGSLPLLYSVTATGAINVWLCWVERDEVRVSWGQRGGTMQEAAFKCEPKNLGKINETTAHQQAIKEAISKWKKMVKKKYSPSLETAGETARIKPMLAQDFTKQKRSLVYPATCQPKLDGVRCLAYRKNGQPYLQSRGGDPWLLDHIKNELTHALPERDFVLDGELYLHGASLQTITSLAKRSREESKTLTYCIYDIFKSTGEEIPWYQRKDYLELFFTTWGPTFKHIWQVPSIEVRDEAAIVSLHRAFVEEGYEGAIIRSYTGNYVEGYRSPDLLKYKAWQDAEYVVKNWYVGKGKFENVPMFVCVTPEGKEFAVTPVGSQSERQEMLRNATSYIGKLMKVKYLDKTDDGAPKCARGLGIRDPMDM